MIKVMLGCFSLMAIIMGIAFYCSIPNFYEGEIVGKSFKAAHTQTILVYNAATKTSLPHVHSYPDTWRVTITNGSDFETFKVDEEFYNTHKKGDYVSFK